MNIFRILQQWLNGLSGDARAGRGVRQRRRARSNPSSAAASSTLERPASVGIREEMRPTQEATSTTTVTTLKWVNYEQSGVVAERNVGGMVYLGPDLRQGALSATWRPTIVPTLPVAASGPDITGDGMPYWPSYSEIGPNSRAAYLDWLATGRSDRRYGVGHVFLYFYGLERRFFIDSSGPHERRIIIDEVDRLLQIYGDHRSVRRCFESFLDAAKVSLASDEELKPRFWTAGYELPLGLRVALGRRAGDGLPLNADWALSWYCAHPDYALRTTASRAFPEFQAIFRILFAERYPAGMKIPLPKRTLRAQYQSASSDFEVGLEEHIGAVPDISRITQPLNAARNLVEEATDSLDKYSRFLGRNPNGRGTIEAHALLPERLWEVFPSSEMDSLREWAGEIIGAGGLCPVEAVVERLEGAAPESIGKRQLTDAIVDYKLFWVTCRDEQEAYYLLAIINSDALYELVTPLMSKGQFGARDLQKHLWKLPIPEFYAEEPPHAATSEVGRLAAEGATERLAQLRQERTHVTVTIARREIRKWLRESKEGKAVEKAVGDLLARKGDTP